MDVPLKETLERAQALWDTHFNFVGMEKEEFASKFDVRASAAMELATAIIEGKRPACQLKTGGGKTIIAFLAAILLEKRTLFLAPAKPLVIQHDDFLQRKMGYHFSSRVIIGDTHKNERRWSDTNERFVFATPEVVLAEIANGVNVLRSIELIIFDEAHHARGNYSYVELGVLARTLGIPYLGMSASLGSNEDDIRALAVTMQFDSIFWYSITAPVRREEYVMISPSKVQRRTEEHGFKPIERDLKSQLMRMLVKLRLRLPPFREELLSADELDEVTRGIRSAKDGKDKAMANIFLASYKKLLYAYRVFITEGYRTFLSYVEAMQKRSSPSDRLLLRRPLFRRIVATAHCYLEMHPKERRFIILIERSVALKKRGVAFFANKETARVLAAVLLEHGIRSACIFGGSAMRRKEQVDTLGKFSAGDIDLLLVTSVIEEGISIPEVDLVVNVHVPNEVRSRRQRAGRTARMHPGEVVHLIMDHPFDLNSFYAVHRKLKALEVVEEDLASGVRPLIAQLLFDF